MVAKVRSRGERIRNYIIENVGRHPSDLAARTAEKFGISRQAVNKHLTKLIDEGALAVEGQTKARTYRLAPLAEWEKTYERVPGLAEDIVWRKDVAPSLGPLPGNVLEIWQYGFTEMFNNAIDHSGGTEIRVHLTKTAASSEIWLRDNGVGIFKKIQSALGLEDERHAVLELSKGKLTTDPKRHSGEGIFFTSRMFDDFQILSGETFFSHKHGEERDWVLERGRLASGTLVWLKLGNHTPRTPNKVFAQYTSGDDFGFTKTVVPVRLAQYGNDNLVSRSQAKRLMARVERFKTVLLDFEGVKSIGQAFADEIFRVFKNQHPDLELLAINADEQIRQMISRAQSSG